MPPFTKKKTQANEASMHKVVTAGVTYACIALDALVAFAKNVSGKSNGIPIGYFPNALVARSVTMLLIIKAAMTIARPIADQISVCLALSSFSGLPLLVM